MNWSCGDFMVKLASVIGDFHDEGFVVEDPQHSARGSEAPQGERFETERLNLHLHHKTNFLCCIDRKWSERDLKTSDTAVALQSRGQY